MPGAARRVLPGEDGECSGTPAKKLCRTFFVVGPETALDVPPFVLNFERAGNLERAARSREEVSSRRRDVEPPLRRNEKNFAIILAQDLGNVCANCHGLV